MREVYLIILTGFAVLGVYCFTDTVFSALYFRKFPETVTIIKNTQDDATFKKIKYIEQNLPNNYTLFYPFDSNLGEKEQLEILDKYLKNVLNVNKQ